MGWGRRWRRERGREGRGGRKGVWPGRAIADFRDVERRPSSWFAAPLARVQVPGVDELFAWLVGAMGRGGVQVGKGVSTGVQALGVSVCPRCVQGRSKGS